MSPTIDCFRFFMRMADGPQAIPPSAVHLSPWEAFCQLSSSINCLIKRDRVHVFTHDQVRADKSG